MDTVKNKDTRFPWGNMFLQIAGVLFFLTSIFQPKADAQNASDQIFWTQENINGKVWRADLSGNNRDSLYVQADTNDVWGMAYHDDTIYWVEKSNKIRSSDLDGTNKQLVIDMSQPSLLDLHVDSTNSKMYVTDFGGGSIHRMNLDGTDLQAITSQSNQLTTSESKKLATAPNEESMEELVNQLGKDAIGSTPWGVAVDESSGMIYWTDQSSDVIQRANLDGSNSEVIIDSSFLNAPRGIAIDTRNDKLYFVDSFNEAIKRSNLDGSDIETVYEYTGTDTWNALDLTINHENDYLYWTENSQGNVYRTDMDGSNVVVLDNVNDSMTEALGIATGGSVSTSSNEKLNLTFNQTGATNFPTIVNYVTVTDSVGDPVTGLDETNFTVAEDGSTQTIQSVSEVGGSGSNIAAGLVMDRSGSMDAAISDAKNAAKQFVDEMEAGDRGAVISFSSDVRVDQYFTTDHSAIRSAIDALSANGQTAFYDAVITALDRANLQTGRQAVLALTDGVDNSSSATLQEVIDRAQTVQIPVYTIGLGSGIEEADLKEIANESGGRYYQAPGTSDLQAIYEDISQQLNNQYEIVYETTNDQADGTQRDVEITANVSGEQGSDMNQYTAPLQQAGPPIYPVIRSTPEPGSSFWVDVKVGTSSEPVSNLFGASFELTYDTTHVSVVEDTVGTFLGSDLLYVSNVLPFQQHVGIGASRKAGQGGVDGSGVVARVKFKVDQDAIYGSLLEFGLQNVEANDPNGAPIVLSAETRRDTIESNVRVWPGDANNDGTVDQSDVLPIGVYWDMSGPSRPSATNQWEGQQVQPWSNVDATYADANGDGVVREDDVLPIGLNWGKTHQVNNNAMVASSADKSSYGQLHAEMTHLEDDRYEISIIGEASKPLQGVAFELGFDTEQLQVNEVQTGDWIGSDLIQHVNTDNSSGTVAAGYSRLPSDAAITDQGVIAKMNVTMTGNSNEPVNLKFTEAEASAANSKTFGKLDTKTMTSLQDQSVPDQFELTGNYPNPFNPTTTIQYALPEAVPVQLTVYSVDGRQIKTLVDQQQKAGTHRVKFNAEGLASGIYMYRLQAPGFTKTKRMMLVK